MTANSAIAQIYSLTEIVREHINTHRYQITLIEESHTWNQICSSLDVIEDALSAIESYEDNDYPSDTGLKYIYTYGVLQALFLLQDALRYLSEAFEVPYTPSTALMEVRNIRNASIGHPTKQDHKGQRYYNYISRASMEKNGFDLLRHSKAKELDIMRVDLHTMISAQNIAIRDALQTVVHKLEEVDRMHREKFSNNPLQAIFHSAMGYSLQKIGQGILAQSQADKDFGEIHLQIVKETYEKFRVALEERNELHEYIGLELKEYFYALDKLQSYLTGTGAEITESDARIFHFYVRVQHEHFVEISKEIDRQYNSRS